MASAEIAVSDVAGASAAIETGDLFGYFGTTLFAGITVPLFADKFCGEDRAVR
jgi:hypothetical protein